MAEMAKMLYAGLDIHKNTIHGMIVDESGKVLENRNFASCREDIDLFLCNRPIF